MRLSTFNRPLLCLLLSLCSALSLAKDDGTVAVNAYDFIRAETDLYFKITVQQGRFGKLVHSPTPTPIDQQNAPQINRDTLYSSGVFDLDAGPVSITLPEHHERFMSMQVISQDHYTTSLTYTPGRHTYDRNRVGTRYALVIVRVQANAEEPGDLAIAHHLQEAIKVEQANPGTYESVPWDAASQAKVRRALEAMASLGGGSKFFGTRAQVNPVAHLIGTAISWGGIPEYGAKFFTGRPKQNDGRTVHTLTVKDVPVAGFWSISVYNEAGYFEKNPLEIYSLNSRTAKPDANGVYTLQFGNCEATTLNCLPITQGWSYVVRLYRPSQKILKGQWTFPKPIPVL